MSYRPLKWCALLVGLLLASCGDESAPKPTIPVWAKVAPEQIAEAEKHGVPVAFENDLGMRFVLIPAGTFLMGSPEDDGYGADDERPQHEVTLTSPYYFQITEVTNEQYLRFKPEHDWTTDSDDQSRLYRSLARTTFGGDRQPVVSVSWQGACEFADWATGNDPERKYRLPTEAEWEYACRAGTTTRFWCGDTEESLARVAWYSNTGDWDGLATNPVAGKAANPWGLYDTHGNVAEYCQDWYGAYGGHPLRDPRGPSRSVRHIKDPSGRVHRGGSFMHPWVDLRSATRTAGPEDSAFCNVGLRLLSPLPR